MKTIAVNSKQQSISTHSHMGKYCPGWNTSIILKCPQCYITVNKYNGFGMTWDFYYEINNPFSTINAYDE